MTVARADRILSRVELRGRSAPVVVLLDGRSGSGKSTLGRQLADRLSAQLLGVDELYPGWGGLVAGAQSVAGALRAASYVRYDWALGEFRDTVRLDAGEPIVVEGCGALTAQNRAVARLWGGAARGEVLSLWLQCPAGVRFQRAMQRDGELFRPYWAQWRAQEDAHFARERPWALATEIVQSR